MASLDTFAYSTTLHRLKIVDDLVELLVIQVKHRGHLAPKAKGVRVTDKSEELRAISIAQDILRDIELWTKLPPNEIQGVA